MQHKGVFCVSLDFELHWGVFDKKHLPEYKAYFDKTRQIIPRLLDVFDKYGVHCTWATVGALAVQDKHSQYNDFRIINPKYRNNKLNPISVETEKDEFDDPYHFAESIIEEIRACPNQEIGTHTFSHFYTLEPGADIEAYEKDLNLSKRVLKSPVSLVFPRNQYNSAYLSSSKKYGINIARSNPNDWFWSSEAQSQESLIKKIARTLDHYLPIGNTTSFPLDDVFAKSNEPLLLPASRFFRPPSSIDSFFPGFKVRRIISEVKKAAYKNHVYHLWWHPHNFAVDTEKSFSDLDKILQQYQELHKDGKMISLNMGEIADIKTGEIA